ncbi:MAG: DNA primase [Muribaculaceae bacterium]|nr:DNA primase [Muribaculaceae bacterium]
MKKIDRETVQRIIDTADIVEVVSDFVHLRRSGSGYVGLCPFHNERTPSFHVSKSKGICKCFSCGKGGSPVNFVMEHEQMTYWEALRYLANKYHIEIQEHEVTDAERREMNERTAMMEVNEFAMKHFQSNMSDTPEGRDVGMAYFRERGINEWAVERFRLGYAPDRRDDLLKAALAAGYNEKYLVDTGLCGRSERGTLYDRFKARVMYPVFTISGKVVAFGGRTLSSSKEIAKYINSPESLIYSKSRELYGLYQAKQAIVKKDKCILVEGYMDVISMHQQGVENVVASSGTSLTQGQIRLIHRFTENVTVIYDSDPAGIKASLRGIDLLLAEGLNIKVVLLPEGDDPDSFAQSHGATEVEEYIAANEVDFIRFKIDMLLNDCRNDPVKRSKVVGSILQSVANIPNEITRSIYVKECSMTFGIEESVLLRQVRVFMAQMREAAARTVARQAAVDSIRNVPDAQEPPAGGQIVTDRPVAGAEEGRPAQESVDGGGETPAITSQVEHEVPVTAQLVETVSGAENAHARILAPQERSLLRLVLKFGMLGLGDDFGSDERGEPVKVIDFVRDDLEVDNVKFTNAIYQRIYEEALQIRESCWDNDVRVQVEKGAMLRDRLLAEGREEINRTARTTEDINIAEKKLNERVENACAEAMSEFASGYLEKHMLSHPDDSIRAVVTDLVVEKHQLSKIYFKGTKVEGEADRLDDLVPRALIALKYDMARCFVNDLRRDIQALTGAMGSYDLERIYSLMGQMKKWQEFGKQLAMQIGERVYEPLRGN